jgi:hypothetical protein
VISDAVERLRTQIQWYECFISSPDGVVVSLCKVRAEGVFAGVTSRPVAAVMSDGNGFGEGHIEPERPGDGSSDLCNFERVGEAGALMVIGKHEDLRFSCKTTKRARMKDAIAIALEARSERVGCLFKRSVAGTNCTCGEHGEMSILEFLAALSVR